MTTTSTRKPVQEPPSAGEQVDGGPARTATVRLPFVTAQFRVPEVDVGSAVQAVRSSLSTPQRAVYYGGLVALAAFSVIDWPVAAVIGIGTEIARRGVLDQPK
jgi:hypothetical protein